MNKVLGFIKKMNKVLLAIVVLVVLVRAFLPTVLKSTINWYLGNKIESYEGYVDDVDLALYRGAYQIEGLNLWKKGTDPSLPLVFAREIDISLSWKALFDKKINGDLAIDQLKVHLIDSQFKDKKQFGDEEKNWHKILRNLIPIEIETLKITDSEVHFINRDYRIPVDLVMDRIQVTATNLRNTERKNVIVPSQVHLKGRLQRDADFTIKAQFNLLRQPLTLSMDAEIKDFTLKHLNDFFLVYGPFTFARGEFSLFSELATKDSVVKGYIKPFFKDVKMIANEERFVSAKHRIYEVLMGFGNIVLRHTPKEGTATKLEFEGPINAPEVDLWGAVKSSFKHAFGEPLKPQIDKSIGIQSVPKQ